MSGSSHRARIPRASVRLILVPDAGGSPATFRGWSERLPAADVGLVQLPGRGIGFTSRRCSRCTMRPSTSPMRLRAGAGPPTVLFGHGLGASDRVRNRAAAAGAPLAGGRAVRVGASWTCAWPGRAEPRRSSGRSVRRAAAAAPRVAAGLLSDPDAMRLFLLASPGGCRDDGALSIRTGTTARLPDRRVRRDGRSACIAGRHRRLEAGNHRTVQHSAVRRRSVLHPPEKEALTALIGNHLSVMVGALARSAPLPHDA